MGALHDLWVSIQQENHETGTIIGGTSFSIWKKIKYWNYNTDQNYYNIKSPAKDKQLQKVQFRRLYEENKYTVLHYYQVMFRLKSQLA